MIDTQENHYHLCRRCCYFCWPADTKIVEYKCTCEVPKGRNIILSALIKNRGENEVDVVKKKKQR